MKRHHVGMLREKQKQGFTRFAAVFFAGFLLLFAILFSRSLFVIAFLAAVLLVNTLLEFHKLYTQGIPVDLEILTVSIAYLAANEYFVSALFLVLVGPVLAEFARGSFTNAAFFRPLSLLPVLFLAPVFGPSASGLLFSVLVGLAAAYVRVMLTARFHWFYSFVPRFTQLLLALYFIYVVIPFIQ